MQQQYKIGSLIELDDSSIRPTVRYICRIYDINDTYIYLNIIGDIRVNPHSFMYGLHNIYNSQLTTCTIERASHIIHNFNPYLYISRIKIIK